MIIDRIENLNAYGVISKNDVEQISQFIKRVGTEHLSEVKFFLQETDLYAMVQNYETKEKENCRFESHREYIDIQYIVNGKEQLYCDNTEHLGKGGIYNEQNDIIFYDDSNENSSIILEKGMFALLFPWDAHKPCCSVRDKEYVTKIVFKLRVKKNLTF